MNRSEIKQRLKAASVERDISISEALACIDQAGTGALLLCSADGHLRGLVTDGDIRRAILRGTLVDSPCSAVANPHPVTAMTPVSPAKALRIMNEHDINQLPVLDPDGRVRQLLLHKDLSLGRGDVAQRLKLKELILPPRAAISQAMKQLDQAGTGALLWCSPGGKLKGILTDGDIRRAIIKQMPLDHPASEIAHRRPITARHPASAEEALRIMNKHDINQLPVTGADGRVKQFLMRKDLMRESDAIYSAMIMAGGYGTRLLPLTKKIPKPMLPVGDRPLLERMIAQLRKAGIREISLTTHYLPETIAKYFGNGDKFGVHLDYLIEQHPLGTAGGLKLAKKFRSTTLVINGDVLTGVPFRAMLGFHRRFRADLTVGVRKYEFQVPFGVVECKDVHITSVREKPSFSSFINAGIYLVEPDVRDFIPEDKRFDMPELIQRLIEAGRTVVSFPIVEYWLDIGRHEDYKKAQEDILNGKIK